MNWLEAKISINFDEIIFAIELVSNIFHDIGTNGLVIDDQDKTLTDANLNLSWTGHDYNTVTGYLPEDERTAQKCRFLEKKLRWLEKEYGIKTHILYRSVADEDWSECWKTFFWPEKISQKIVVKPTWREYRSEKNKIVLELDPGMAFGTGTHPTTRLCINMIEKYLKPGDLFLDIGTGSGILMLAAYKLGAQKVTGTDNDQTAVEVAKKNLLQNRIENQKFMIFRGNLIEALQKKFNLITANILTEKILMLLNNIRTVMEKGGNLIVSGIMVEHEERVVKKMQAAGFEILDTRTKDGWAGICGRLN
jgi:ribosomal protein L11 methyltransferase